MDHSTNTLTAAIKSLKDGVRPAVDSADPLATQQLALVLDYLAFLRSRLPYLHARARIELRAAQDLAAVLQPHVGAVDAEAVGPLEEALAAAQGLDDLAPLHTVEASTARILAVLREVVRAARGAAADVRHAVERAVLDDSEQMSPLYRSWYLPLGFDPYPDEVEALDDVIVAW